MLTNPEFVARLVALEHRANELADAIHLLFTDALDTEQVDDVE